MKEKPNCIRCGNKVKESDGKFCNHECSSKHKRETRLKEIERLLLSKDFEKIGNKASIDRATKRYLISKYGEKCMLCGWNKINDWTKKVPIELNHIDGNPENHKLDNVELLCPNCHSLSEHTKSRGLGRKWRKTIFTN